MEKKQYTLTTWKSQIFIKARWIFLFFFFYSNQTLPQNNIREAIILLLICIPRNRITRVKSSSDYVQLNLFCIIFLNKRSLAFTGMVGRKFRTSSPYQSPNREEKVMLLKRILEELCQVILALGSNLSRKKMSEIKLFKVTLGKRICLYAASENFTVSILHLSVWFQYLSVTGKGHVSGNFGRKEKITHKNWTLVQTIGGLQYI